MTVSTQISPLMPVAPPTSAQTPAAANAGAVAAAAQAVQPAPATAPSTAGQRHAGGEAPRDPKPQVSDRPTAPRHMQIAALIEIATQLAGRANAGGGGAAMASQMSATLAAAAARTGFDVTGALVVAQDDQAVLGAGSFYHFGQLVASFVGHAVTYVSGPAHLDLRG